MPDHTRRATSRGYQAPMIGEDIVAAMDDAGVDRVAIWGYSRGARLELR